MNVITWLIVGGVIGGLANRIMNTHGGQALVLNVVVGVLGGMVGGWLLTPLMGADIAREPALSGLSFLVSFTGAMILLVIVNVVRQIAAGGD